MNLKKSTSGKQSKQKQSKSRKKSKKSKSNKKRERKNSKEISGILASEDENVEEPPLKKNDWRGVRIRTVHAPLKDCEDLLNNEPITLGLTGKQDGRGRSRSNQLSDELVFCKKESIQTNLFGNNNNSKFGQIERVICQISPGNKHLFAVVAGQNIQQQPSSCKNEASQNYYEFSTILVTMNQNINSGAYEVSQEAVIADKSYSTILLHAMSRYICDRDVYNAVTMEYMQQLDDIQEVFSLCEFDSDTIIVGCGLFYVRFYEFNYALQKYKKVYQFRFEHGVANQGQLIATQRVMHLKEWFLVCSGRTLRFFPCYKQNSEDRNMLKIMNRSDTKEAGIFQAVMNNKQIKTQPQMSNFTDKHFPKPELIQEVSLDYWKQIQTAELRVQKDVTQTTTTPIRPKSMEVFSIGKDKVRVMKGAIKSHLISVEQHFELIIVLSYMSVSVLHCSGSTSYFLHCINFEAKKLDYKLNLGLIPFRDPLKNQEQMSNVKSQFDEFDFAERVSKDRKLGRLEVPLVQISHELGRNDIWDFEKQKKVNLRVPVTKNSQDEELNMLNASDKIGFDNFKYQTMIDIGGKYVSLGIDSTQGCLALMLNHEVDKTLKEVQKDQEEIIKDDFDPN